MTQLAYEDVLETVAEALAAASAEPVQYELPFAANDNEPTDWLDIPFPAGWEATC